MLVAAFAGAAHVILVNSKFTGDAFKRGFSRLARRGVTPEVLYPAVALPSDETLAQASRSWQDELPPDLVRFIRGGITFTSINRFERKKGVQLAIDALLELQAQQPLCKVRLIIAGEQQRIGCAMEPLFVVLKVVKCNTHRHRLQPSVFIVTLQASSCNYR